MLQRNMQSRRRGSSVLSALCLVAGLVSCQGSAFPPVASIATCTAGGSPTNYPVFAWTDNGDGTYSGDLHYDTLKYTTGPGGAFSTTTRGYNGMMPGPVMRMKPGKTYYLTLHNDIDEGWANPNPGLNKYRLPCSTNLHVHGLHISSESPADDVAIEIEPGHSHTYQYDISSDHNGGTFWYHPHLHGAGTLQTNLGGAGMLIIEDSNAVSGPKPNDWPKPSLPEATIVMQQMVKIFYTSQIQGPVPVITQYGDQVYQTNDPKPLTYLINGCDAADSTFALSLTKGKWMRVRMLNVGFAENILVSLEPKNGIGACRVGAYGFDGVTLSPAPRYLDTNELFFTTAGRVDMLIRCDEAGEHNIRIRSPENFILTLPPVQYNAIVGKIVVTGTGANAADLSLWYPKRPKYLKDLQTVTPDNSTTVEVLGVAPNRLINGFQYKEDGSVLFDFGINTIQEFVHIKSEEHPMHMHVNHVQLKEVTNHAYAPNWYRPGDWLDTVSVPHAVSRFVLDRYTGNQVPMHCHILTHADLGMLATIRISPESCTNKSWGKCGGSSSFKGPTCCPARWECVYKNAYYSQCLPKA